jgi:hypothetical protein
VKDVIFDRRGFIREGVICVIFDRRGFIREGVISVIFDRRGFIREGVICVINLVVNFVSIVFPSYVTVFEEYGIYMLTTC